MQLLDTFLHTLPSGQQYRCLVLERLGSTAAEVLSYLCSRSKGKARRGMSTPALKNMTRQLLLALDHCHRYLSYVCITGAGAVWKPASQPACQQVPDDR